MDNDNQNMREPENINDEFKLLIKRRGDSFYTVDMVNLRNGAFYRVSEFKTLGSATMFCEEYVRIHTVQHGYQVVGMLDIDHTQQGNQQKDEK